MSESIEIVNLQRQSFLDDNAIHEERCSDTDIADVDVSRSTSRDYGSYTRRARSVVLAPADFQATVLDADSLGNSCVHQS